ncbi:MAG: hypothetical protein ACTSPU_00065 [Promethearchaeota archaeon]
MHQVESKHGELLLLKMTFKDFAKSAGRGYVEGSKRAMKRGEKARKVIGESRFEPYKKKKKKGKSGFEKAGTTKGIKKVNDPRKLMAQL